MKKNAYLLVFLLVLIIPFNTFAKEKVTINLFHSYTCPHCKEEIEWLESIKDDYDIEINYYEKDEYPELLKETRKNLNIDNTYTPLTVIGTDYIIGFSSVTKEDILDMIESYEDKEYCDIVSRGDVSVSDCFKINDGTYNESSVKKIPFIGKVDVKDTSLFLIALIIGLVDGFNPCAMWVLIFIISLLIDMKDKKKMITLGMVFLVSSALVYLFFMLAWLKITNSLMSTWFRYVIAIVAISAGIINLRNYLKTRKSDTGCTVTKKEDRKKIMVRAKKVISENKFILSVLGIIALAFSVNLVELACSAGLPTFFITILGMNDLSSFEYAFYIFIYILFFMIDDIIVFLVATLTFKIKGISNKYTKYSHLIGGLICLIIGILLAFFPKIIMFNF